MNGHISSDIIFPTGYMIRMKPLSMSFHPLSSFYVKFVSTFAACSQVSLIRWAYEALCVNEFSGLVLVPESSAGPLSVTKGEQVLENMGYAPGKSTVKGMLQRRKVWYVAGGGEEEIDYFLHLAFKAGIIS